MHIKREVMPGDLTATDLEAYIRDAASTHWHQVGTAKMGNDSTSVVDGRLKVYGVENLRVADGSIMPRITTANTMAPCVVIAERAGELLTSEHELKAIGSVAPDFTLPGARCLLSVGCSAPPIIRSRHFL